MDVAFHITRRHNLNAHSDPLNLIIFPLLLLKCALSHKWGSCSIGVSLRTGYHNSSFILVIVFCNGLHLFQRHASWMSLAFFLAKYFLQISYIRMLNGRASGDMIYQVKYFTEAWTILLVLITLYYGIYLYVNNFLWITHMLKTQFWNHFFGVSSLIYDLPENKRINRSY